jgi:hypothetical protein
MEPVYDGELSVLVCEHFECIGTRRCSHVVDRHAALRVAIAMIITPIADAISSGDIEAVHSAMERPSIIVRCPASSAGAGNITVSGLRNRLVIRLNSHATNHLKGIRACLSRPSELRDFVDIFEAYYYTFARLQSCYIVALSLAAYIADNADAILASSSTPPPVFVTDATINARAITDTVRRGPQPALNPSNNAKNMLFVNAVSLVKFRSSLYPPCPRRRADRRYTKDDDEPVAVHMS